MKSPRVENVLDFAVSPPSRGRGLKYSDPCLPCLLNRVAPLAGAWIEIFFVRDHRGWPRCRPLAGAWIEIFFVRDHRGWPRCRPLAGAWIEMMWLAKLNHPLRSAPPGVGQQMVILCFLLVLYKFSGCRFLFLNWTRKSKKFKTDTENEKLLRSEPYCLI